MIPRTIDAAKVAAVNDQQSVTQQQQLATHMKQAAAEQQQQVQTTKEAQHDGKVTTEDLHKEKQQGRRQNKKDAEQSGDAANEAPATRLEPQDPLRGHMIDIKT